METTNNNIEIHEGFFDENFGKWEDDMNSPFHSTSKLQAGKHENASDSTQDRNVKSRSSSRGSSSSHRRARNSRQNNFHGEHRSYYNNYTSRYNDRHNNNDKYNNMIDFKQYQKTNKSSKKWKQAKSPRIMVNGNMQTLKIGFHSPSERQRNANRQQVQGSPPENNNNNNLTLPASSFSSSSELRLFSRTREHDLMAKVGKQDELKSLTRQLSTPLRFMNAQIPAPKKTIVTVKFSKNNKNRDIYSNKKVPPGPLWGRDAYYKPKKLNKKTKMHNANNTRKKGRSSTHNNINIPVSIINVSSASGTYKNSYLKEIKSTYMGANVAQHLIHPVLETSLEVEKVQRILSRSKNG